jgi:hypothetical protein
VVDERIIGHKKRKDLYILNAEQKKKGARRTLRFIS